MRSTLHQADSDEKFSYVILQRTVNSHHLARPTTSNADNSSWLRSDAFLLQEMANESYRDLTPLEILAKFVNLEKEVMSDNQQLVDEIIQQAETEDMVNDNDNDSESDSDSDIDPSDGESSDGESSDEDEEDDVVVEKKRVTATSTHRHNNNNKRSIPVSPDNQDQHETDAMIVKVGRDEELALTKPNGIPRVITMADMRNLSDEDLAQLPDFIRIKKVKHPKLQKLVDELLVQVSVIGISERHIMHD